MEKAVPPLSVQKNSKEEGVDLPKRSIMTRPGFGTSGRRVSLLSNHFKVSIKNQNELFYQYSVKSKCLPLSYIYIYNMHLTYPLLLQVSITYEDDVSVDSKLIGRKVIDKLYQTYSSELAEKRFAYDGEKSLFTVGPLPKNKFEFVVILEESTAKR